MVLLARIPDVCTMYFPQMKYSSECLISWFSLQLQSATISWLVPQQFAEGFQCGWLGMMETVVVRYIILRKSCVEDLRSYIGTTLLDNINQFVQT